MAAYLNAAIGLDYPYTLSELEGMWDDASDGDDSDGELLALHIALHAANNRQQPAQQRSLRGLSKFALHARDKPTYGVRIPYRHPYPSGFGWRTRTPDCVLAFVSHGEDTAAPTGPLPYEWAARPLHVQAVGRLEWRGTTDRPVCPRPIGKQLKRSSRRAGRMARPPAWVGDVCLGGTIGPYEDPGHGWCVLTLTRRYEDHRDLCPIPLGRTSYLRSAYQQRTSLTYSPA